MYKLDFVDTLQEYLILAAKNVRKREIWHW